MSRVRRVYVEKKRDYAVKARELESEIRSYLGIAGVTKVRELVRYDAENVSDETYRKAVVSVFSEPPVDDVYEEEFDADGARVFSVEYLPGQFDQRADSAEQCVKLLNEEENPVIRTATTYVIEGDITDEQLEAIKQHCINPVDSRETGLIAARAVTVAGRSQNNHIRLIPERPAWRNRRHWHRILPIRRM